MTITKSPAERFWPKVNKSDGCWEWTAAKVKGYGSFYGGECTVLAHRFSYELLVAPIPDGLVIDHLCRNKACVNPDHLEVVTQAKNVERGISAEATRLRYASRTHCKNGHELPADARVVKSGTGRTYRLCYVCKLASARRRYHERRAEQMIEVAA